MAGSERPKNVFNFFPDAEDVEDNYGKQIPIGRQMPPDIYDRIAWDMIYFNSLSKKKA